MTATEQLIAKQVSDVFPASVDDLPLSDAARRGLIAPLRNLRVPPAAAVNSVPIVGGDFEERALAAALDHQALNQAAASLYRDRFSSTPGIVSAAGVDHAYHLAQEFRAAGLAAEAVSGRTPPLQLAETLAAYERGEINVLINAQLLAEGWNSPRATVCMHLAPTASPRRAPVISGEGERVDPSRLADDEALLWARIAGRQIRFDERQQFAEKLATAARETREAFLIRCAAENPNRPLRP